MRALFYNTISICANALSSITLCSRLQKKSLISSAYPNDFNGTIKSVTRHLIRHIQKTLQSADTWVIAKDYRERRRPVRQFCITKTSTAVLSTDAKKLIKRLSIQPKFSSSKYEKRNLITYKGAKVMKTTRLYSITRQWQHQFCH